MTYLQSVFVFIYILQVHGLKILIDLNTVSFMDRSVSNFIHKSIYSKPCLSTELIKSRKILNNFDKFFLSCVVAWEPIWPRFCLGKQLPSKESMNLGQDA